MRNPQRIKELMSVLTDIWKLQPDTRFNQMIHNLQGDFAMKNNNGFRDAWEREDFFGKISFTPTRYLDLFYIEDDDFLKFLKETYNELKDCELR